MDLSTENKKESCLQRDSAEREEYAGARRSFRRIWKERDSAEPELLEAILDRRNMNKAYKRVKANKGAPGIDGMTIEEALPYLRDHKDELIKRMLRGKYTPSPVRRVEIPKPDGGIRKLGIPTVIDRIIQQAISQKLMPIYEPKFSDGSYGYRPGRSAKDAISKVKEYVEEGYRYAVSLDLSKYFDTLNHERLLNLLRKEIEDERVIQIIKRYLKSGVMESGVVMETEEGSPQGGNLSPLLANIYLDEFDKEFERRGVPCVRYADDIVLLARSERAAKRLLETSTSYLEGKLKLTVNREKSKVTSVFAIRNFKFLGFALGRNGSGVFIRVHPKSWEKMKAKLKDLSSRRHVQSVIPALYKIKVYMRGWLSYYGIAAMKNAIEDLNGWLYHRIRMCIWKMWKRPRSKMKYLIKLGVPEQLAYRAANSRQKYWFVSNTVAVKMGLTKEILVRKGFYDLADAYQKMHVNY
ncbi:MAG: group II intron reverse transcriptase/maturase [Firmicutes bacterium]|nr:group II intron reverse transcriptase/maturase [Bacillota bacterium]